MTQAELAAPGEPRRLARRVDRAWLGGVCAGLAEHLGLAPVLVRALFVTVAAWKLVGVGLYLLFWLALPPIEEAHDAPGLDAHSRRGMRTVDSLAVPRGVDLGQGIALALLAAGLLWLVQQIGWGLPAWWLIAGLAAASGLGLIWYQADRIVPTRGESDGWGRWWRPSQPTGRR